MTTVDLYAQGPFVAAIRNLRKILSKPECKHLITQLITALSDYYVHLPLKQASFSIDPIHELEILRDDDELLGDDGLAALHRILRIFNSLRDRHTTLTLPRPWADMVAYLPILIEEYYVGKEARYIISKKLYGYVNDDIVLGSRITHWNGMPIHLYLQNILGEESQGANRDATMRLVLASLTIRPLAYVLLPNEDWVTFSCVSPQGVSKTYSLAWKYFVEQKGLSNTSLKQGNAEARLDIGLDSNVLQINRCIAELFAAPSAKPDAKAGSDVAQASPTTGVTSRLVGPCQSQMESYGGILKYGAIETTSGLVGYIRIYSFEINDLDGYIPRMVEILQNLPQERLIIDIRGNPGGLIPAGESLAQLLSNHAVTPAPVAFRNTRATMPFGALPEFAQWNPSLQAMTVSAEPYAQFIPLSNLALLPPFRYPGKSALIIDALSYSTCDFLAADFKDNHVGIVVGTDKNTGAGGANVWTYDTLANYARQAKSRLLEPLPQGMGLNVAVRRSVRTGARSGFPIENFGVAVDYRHFTTYRDLLDNNVDLINFTASLLAQAN